MPRKLNRFYWLLFTSIAMLALAHAQNAKPAVASKASDAPKPAAAAAAKPSSKVAAPDLAKQSTLYVVGYAHLDTQWRWEYPQTIKEFLPRTMHDNFALFEKYPHYIFNFS